MSDNVTAVSLVRLFHMGHMGLYWHWKDLQSNLHVSGSLEPYQSWIHVTYKQKCEP